MKREAAVQQIRVREKLSYAEAVKRVRQESLTQNQWWDKEQGIANAKLK